MTVTFPASLLDMTGNVVLILLLCLGLAALIYAIRDTYQARMLAERRERVRILDDRIMALEAENARLKDFRSSQTVDLQRRIEYAVDVLNGEVDMSEETP